MQDVQGVTSQFNVNEADTALMVAGTGEDACILTWDTDLLAGVPRHVISTSFAPVPTGLSRVACAFDALPANSLVLCRRLDRARRSSSKCWCWLDLRNTGRRAWARWNEQRLANGYSYMFRLSGDDSRDRHIKGSRCKYPADGSQYVPTKDPVPVLAILKQASALISNDIPAQQSVTEVYVERPHTSRTI